MSRSLDGHPLAVELLARCLEVRDGRVVIPNDLGGSVLGRSDLGGSDLGGSDLGGSDLGGSDLGSERPPHRSVAAPGVAPDPDAAAGLHQVIARSHGRLSPPEQLAYRRLAVFRGGFVLQDAAAVVADPKDDPDEVEGAILSLVDHWLVRLEAGRGTDGAVRYRLLEPLRQDAWLRLVAAKEVDETRRRHGRHFATLAVTLSPRLRQPDQDRWLRRLDDESANLVAALTDLATGDTDCHADDAGLALRAAAGMSYYWQIRGLCNEGRRILDRVLAPVTERATRAFVNAATWSANLAFHVGDYVAARRGWEEALTWADQLGNAELRARLHLNLSAAHIIGVSLEEAERSLHAAVDLLRTVDLPGEMATALLNLGVVAERRDDTTTARRRYEEALAIRREVGDPYAVANALNNLGTADERDDDLTASIAHHEEALSIRRELGDPHGIADSLHNLGAGFLRLSRTDEGIAHLTEARQLRRTMGSPRVADSIDLLALAHLNRDPEEAARLLGEAAAVRERRNAIPTPSVARERAAITAALVRALGADRVASLQAEGRARGKESDHGG
jgi:tetratricopeptide (TPR) repeat protein